MVSEFEIHNEFFGGPRRLWLQPSPREATDCVVFLDAELYINRVGAPAIVRELQTEGGLASTCCLYLSAPDGAARHREFACNEAFSALLATDLQLWLGQKTGFAGRFHLCGLSLSGLAAAFAVLGHPNAFAGAICQSPSAWWNDEWLTNWLPMDGGRRGRFWLSVGEGETTSGISHPPSGMYQGTSQLASVGRLAEALGKLGADLHYQTYVGGHDPVCWARELPQALSWLLHGA